MRIEEIEVAKIRDPELQLREEVDVQGLEELASSMKELGLINPITVKRVGDEYVLVAGYRRLQAAKMLGWEKIPAQVIEADSRESALLSVVENIHRRDLNPMELARAISFMLNEMGMSRMEIAKVFGRDISWVSQQLALLDMPEYLQEAVETGQISKSVALELRRIPDEELRQMYTAQAVQYGATERTARQWVQAALASQAAKEARERMREREEEEIAPPPEPEIPRCDICGAPGDKVALEELKICWHCKQLIENPPSSTS